MYLLSLVVVFDQHGRFDTVVMRKAMYLYPPALLVQGPSRSHDNARRFQMLFTLSCQLALTDREMPQCIYNKDVNIYKGFISKNGD